MKTVLAPTARLREFVTNYVLIEETLAAESPIVARSTVTLGFLLGDRSHVFDHRMSHITQVPLTLVGGPQTQRWVDLQPMRRHAYFFARFEPGGFQRLFGVDGIELSDHAAYSGTDVIGPEVGALRDVIADAPTARAKVRILETFLLSRTSRARADEPVHRAARVLTARHGGCNEARLLEASSMSDRQFRRRFLRLHGMSPKHYAKVERFSYALRLKESRPWLSWADVSAEAGYFDQMHLVKDCKALGGAPPTRLLDIAAMRPFCEDQLRFAESGEG